MKLANKVALVTGATRGLGLGLALAYAREGATVVVSARHAQDVEATAEKIRALGGEALGVAADVACSQSVAQMFSRILDRFGTLDILVNNAALTPSDAGSAKARKEAMDLMTTPIPKRSLGVTRNMTDETWANMIAVNLTGTFYCTREALKVMEDRKYGKIVNIASTAGISGLSFHSPHYSASKGGIVALTKSVALEVIGAGVNVNCIAAGAIATDAWAEAIEKLGPALYNQVTQMIPAGRFATIDEIASLAVYLASDEAAYLVGQTISPNGGLVT
jgi:3-oxoacyl-[acyl-carrier protein] reductase